MLLRAFRSAAEMEAAAQDLKAEGRVVVYAHLRYAVPERDAQWWVLRRLNSPDGFLDYGFDHARRSSCRTACEALETALDLQRNFGKECRYIIVVKR